MTKTGLLSSLGVAVLAAGGIGASALAAPARNTAPPPNVAKTAAAPSVHYSIAVRLVKQRQPMTLHISGGSSRDRVAVHLQLGDVKLKDGTTVRGTSGAIMLSRPFLYERAPSGLEVNGMTWLRLPTTGLAQDSDALSTVRSLTPSPLLHVIQEAELRRTARPGWWAGTASYDDAVVQTALDRLGGGLQYRGLTVAVLVARDGLIRAVRITGHTADRSTSLALHARLWGYGVPVKVVPPKPGTFMDAQLAKLSA